MSKKLTYPPEIVKELQKFEPYWYQKELIDAVEKKGYRKILSVQSRRAGKDLCCLQVIIRAALRRRGNYLYMLPTHTQARKVIYNGLTLDGTPFLSYIPKALISKQLNNEMFIRLVNGSQLYFCGSNAFDCYDDQTEILTEDGWKLFKDLTSEKVATLEKGFLTYKKPIEYMQYDYEGDMYCMNTSATNFKVTPNHRFYIKSQKGFYKFKEISDPTIRHDQIPLSSKWKGNSPSTINGYNAKDFVSLLGIYLAEGSCYKSKKGYRVYIAQIKEDRRKEIAELLKRLSLKYYLSDKSFEVWNKDLYEYFVQFGTQEKRYIPKDIKALDKQLLEVLFEWLLKGDGYSGKYTAYYSTSKKLMDDIQEILIKIGYSGNIFIKHQKQSIIRGRIVKPRLTLYQITVRKSKFKQLKDSKSIARYCKEKYKGMVYCVRVPSGVIKVRRDGKEMWCGNSYRGISPMGVVFSEAAYSHPLAYSTISPALLFNDGFSIHISTPFGENFFYDLFLAAKQSDKWFVQYLPYDKTGHITKEQIDQEIADGTISDQMASQEYSCRWDIGCEGSYYAKYVNDLLLNDQITDVPWDKRYPVNTSFDLGMDDHTAIIFFQVIGTNIHIIDFYMNNNLAIEHYIKYVLEKPYIYGAHIWPHDGEQRQKMGGQKLSDMAFDLGLKTQMAQQVGFAAGIEKVRQTFNKFWIDENKCRKLITCMRDYRKQYNTETCKYSDKPYKDYTTDACDSLRYLCVSYESLLQGMTAEDAQALRHKALYGVDHRFPKQLRENNLRRW